MCMSNPTLPPLLSLQSVSITIAGRTILQDITWDIQRGDNWFIIGRNGSGKSTLLNTILGHLMPSHGQLLRADNFSCASVAQQCQLSGDLPMTVSEYVGMGLTNFSRWRSSRERKQRINDILSCCDLHALNQRALRTLSGGERRRAMIARAWALAPDLLLLDEPSAHLDADSEDHLHAMLRDISHARMSLLYVTHDPRAIAAMPGRIALVNDGTLREITHEEAHHYFAGHLLKPHPHHHRSHGPHG
jgi:ABC-type Mn2+/Zn2+ transport system ATPase subunit